MKTYARAWPLVLLFLIFFLSACAQPPEPERAAPSSSSGRSAQPVISTEVAEWAPQQDRLVHVPAAVPDVDTSKHSVPLDQVIFDTFSTVNRELPLTDADPSRILELRDLIPPIHEPQYEAAAEAGWLHDNDVVIGYVAGNAAWAYPLHILNYHEIVNDFLGGEPVLISYCPLCYSGIVYSRRLGDDVLTFGNTSALYESDMVMLDYQTGSYWWQVAGEAIVGAQTGARLTPLPSQTIRWGDWLRLYPQTLVLSRTTGFTRDYSRDPFRGYADMVNEGQFVFPVSEEGLDGRLLPGATVLLVKIGDDVRAYPFEQAGRSAVNDVVGDSRVVVFLDGEAGTGAGFSPIIDGDALTFAVEAGEIVDKETSTRWDLAGRAVDGALAGRALTAIPTKTSFWFAAVAAEPTVRVYGEQ